MIALLATFALLSAFVYESEACGAPPRRPPPPPPPPPGEPPVPPVPPPIVKVVRERDQQMTRNNCKQVAVSAQNADALANGEGLTADQQQSYDQNKQLLTSNECLNAENYRYECEFTVYSEIALSVIYHPTGCGCAFTISVVKPRPRLPDVAGLMSVNAAYSTTVTKFALVVYDVVANEVEAAIPEFDDMKLNANTTKLIEDAVAADPNGDFSSITAGFAGTIKELPTLPAQLNKNDPANANFVPAIMFTIQQVYTTGAMFVVPCTIDMSTAPNAYMSQCQPWRSGDPFSYRKRAALDVDEAEADAPAVVWFREFYLFPKQSPKCAGSGYQPKSRYITAFYNTAQCNAADGIVSFDREFVSDFKAATVVVGSWEWTRTFTTPTRVVWGVPSAFSPLTAVWCLGYSQINWVSHSNFLPTAEPQTLGVCSTVAAPSSWPAASNEAFKYGEMQPSYPFDQSLLSCAPAFQECASDLTLLAFQNRNPRDFSKQEESVLLTGPRRSFCTVNSQVGVDQVVFDTLTFMGVAAGEALPKRNADDSRHKAPHQIRMVYSAEHGGLVHARHAPHIAHKVNQALRKRAEAPIDADPVANPPGRDNFGFNPATGSVDANGVNGVNAGDHPLQAFPQTYAAPLTLDPVQSASPNEPTVYNTTEVTGTPPKFCTDGELGCTCRDANALSQCDTPAICNSLNYCVPPPCPFGKDGCKANSDNTCDGTLVVGSDGHCIYKPSCEAGTIGCVCDTSNACGTGSCLDGRCIYADNNCGIGSPGCTCNPSDGSCSGGADCDDFSGLCLFESCTVGTPGCRCNKAGAPCDAGFVCGPDGACVESPCSPGSEGCTCLAGKQCNKKGFTCVELDRNGLETACVGVNQCAADQTPKCIAECGVGNILSCPLCDYDRPICKDPTVQYCNPKSYLYGFQPADISLAQLCGTESTSASAISLAIAAVAAAVLAAF